MQAKQSLRRQANQAKWKQQSARAFTKAYMLNKQQDKRLVEEIKTLERVRNTRIRDSKERIWKVTGKGVPIPRLPKPDNMPFYLARPRAVTLPTPNELQSLLPKKIIRSRAKSVSERYNPMSKRRLSTFCADDLNNLQHYQQLLGDMSIEDSILEAQEINNDTDLSNVFEKRPADDVIEKGKDTDSFSGILRERRKTLAATPTVSQAWGESPGNTNGGARVRRNSISTIFPAKARALSAPPQRNHAPKPPIRRTKSAKAGEKEPMPVVNPTTPNSPKEDIKQRRMSIQVLSAFQVGPRKMSQGDTVTSRNEQESGRRSQQTLPSTIYEQSEDGKQSPRQRVHFEKETESSHRRGQIRRFGSDMGKWQAKLQIHAKELGINMDKIRQSLQEAKDDEDDYINMFAEMKYCRYLRWGKADNNIQEMIADRGRTNPEFMQLKFARKNSRGFSKLGLHDEDDTKKKKR